MVASHAGKFRVLTAEEFGNVVAQFRKLMDWKQITLANEAGVTERTVQRIESGEQVSDETKRQIARGFKLPVDFFTKANYVPTKDEAEASLADAKRKFRVVDALPLQTWRDFEVILEVGHAYLIDGTALPEELQRQVAEFKDAFHDWTWVYSDVGHVERLEACSSLSEQVKKIVGEKHRSVYAIYDAESPATFKVVAMAFYPKDREVRQLVVPRKFNEFDV